MKGHLAVSSGQEPLVAQKRVDFSRGDFVGDLVGMMVGWMDPEVFRFVGRKCRQQIELWDILLPSEIVNLVVDFLERMVLEFVEEGKQHDDQLTPVLFDLTVQLPEEFETVFRGATFKDFKVGLSRRPIQAIRFDAVDDVIDGGTPRSP